MKIRHHVRRLCSPQLRLALALFWLARPVVAAVAIIPAILGLAQLLSEHPKGDTLLGEAGSVYVLELWRLEEPLLRSSAFSALLLLVVGSLGLALPLHHLLMRLLTGLGQTPGLPDVSAPPTEPQATHLSETQHAPPARCERQGSSDAQHSSWLQVVGVWCVSWLLQGSLLLLGALFSGSLWSFLDRAMAEPTRDLVSLTPLLVSTLLCCLVRPFTDVLLTTTVAYGALSRAFEQARSLWAEQGRKLLLFWGVLQVSTLLLLLLTHAVGQNAALLPRTLLHQAAIGLLAVARAVWLSEVASQTSELKGRSHATAER